MVDDIDFAGMDGFEIDDLSVEIAPRGAAEPVWGSTCAFIAIVVVLV